MSWWSKALSPDSLLVSSFPTAFVSLSSVMQGLYEMSVPFPHPIALHQWLTFWLPLTRLHFPNRVRCWFEDLNKGNVFLIKPYYLYELIIAFHAGLRILIDIYSNRNHAYRWQLVTIPGSVLYNYRSQLFPDHVPLVY